MTINKKGHYQCTEIIMDGDGNIYDPRQYALCNLCKDIVLRSQLVSAEHGLHKDYKLLVCSECYATSPMVKR